VTEKPIYPTVSSVVNPGQHALTSQKANLDFLIYLPEAYGTDPETKWPLIIYLHDAEWRGTDPDILRGEYNPEYMIVSLPKVLETRKDLPFIVISPVGNGGWQFWSTDEMITPLFTLLEEIQSFYSVDPKRIYLTGSGMGGNGVWAIGLRHPEYFAALAPLDGYLGYPFAIPENICDLKDVPIWAFHGGNDFMVPVEVEQELVDSLNACGGNAQITVEPDVVIPGEIYAQPELYEWFLSQSKE
jgi:predicted peptidase